jgi:hypothetical protein
MGAATAAEREVVTVVRLGETDRNSNDCYGAGVVREAAAPTAAAAGVGEDAEGAASVQAATIAVLVPFREDGSGRATQLSALLARLAALFPTPGQCCVMVAEQSADARRFNRGQLLNAAFLHLRAVHPEWTDSNTLFCFHDCDMLPAPSLAHHYLRPLCSASESASGANGLDSSSAQPQAPAVRVLQAGGSRYDGDACFGGGLRTKP